MRIKSGIGLASSRAAVDAARRRGAPHTRHPVVSPRSGGPLRPDQARIPLSPARSAACTHHGPSGDTFRIHVAKAATVPPVPSSGVSCREAGFAPPQSGSRHLSLLLTSVLRLRLSKDFAAAGRAITANAH